MVLVDSRVENGDIRSRTRHPSPDAISANHRHVPWDRLVWRRRWRCRRGRRWRRAARQAEADGWEPRSELKADAAESGRTALLAGRQTLRAVPALVGVIRPIRSRVPRHGTSRRSAAIRALAPEGEHFEVLDDFGDAFFTTQLVGLLVGERCDSGADVFEVEDLLRVIVLLGLEHANALGKA